MLPCRTHNFRLPHQNYQLMGSVWWGYPFKLGYTAAWLKGTVSRDFLPLVFFFKQLLLAPVDKPSNDFDFFRIFAEISDYFGASPVSTTPVSDTFTVLKSFTGVNPCRWHRWRHASPVSLIPGSKYCQLRRCQWHRRCMSLPVSMTPAMHALPVSLIPLMHQ